MQRVSSAGRERHALFSALIKEILFPSLFKAEEKWFGASFKVIHLLQARSSLFVGNVLENFWLRWEGPLLYRSKCQTKKKKKVFIIKAFVWKIKILTAGCEGITFLKCGKKTRTHIQFYLHALSNVYFLIMFWEIGGGRGQNEEKNLLNMPINI